MGRLSGKVAHINNHNNRKYKQDSLVQLLKRPYGDYSVRLERMILASERIHNELDFDSLLDTILGQLESIVEYSGASIKLLDGEQLVAVAHRGPLPKERVLGNYTPISKQPFNELILRKRRPVRISNIQANTHSARRFRESAASQTLTGYVRSGYYRSWVCVPLIGRKQVIGRLSLGHCTANWFTVQDTRILMVFANQAAIAIENAFLYSKARELASMEERQRLARDLHDSVNQHLFAANLVANSLPCIWDKNPAEGKQRLGEFREIMQDAMSGMRSLLQELHPTFTKEMELEKLLQQLAEMHHRRFGVRVDIDVHGKDVLPANVVIAMYHIVQEALNNVIKHARASSISIILQYGSHEIRLTTIDDGSGFNPEAISRGSLGLDIMHERASAIGATLSVESHVGQGTRLSVVWPKP